MIVLIQIPNWNYSVTKSTRWQTYLLTDTWSSGSGARIRHRTYQKAFPALWSRFPMHCSLSPVMTTRTLRSERPSLSRMASLTGTQQSERRFAITGDTNITGGNRP